MKWRCFYYLFFLFATGSSCYAADGATNHNSLTVEDVFKNDPRYKPFVECYQYTFNKIVLDLAKSAEKDDKAYTINILAQGGFKGISLVVIDACSEWFAKKEGIPLDTEAEKNEVSEFLGSMFYLVAAEDDTYLKQKCLSYASDPEWQHIVPRCEKIKSLDWGSK